MRVGFILIKLPLLDDHDGDHHHETRHFRRRSQELEARLRGNSGGPSPSLEPASQRRTCEARESEAN